MRDLLNKVLYGSSGPQPNDGSQVLTIRPHPQDDKLLFVVPAGAPKEAPPLYTISKRDSNPNFVCFRGPPAPENTVAMASMHLSTSRIDLSVYNQPMVVKYGSMSGNWHFDTQMGRFKWKVNPLTGSGFELHDQAGNKVAKYGSAGLMRIGEKQLSVYVPGDEFFMVMVLMSAVSAKELGGIIAEVVGEVAGGVAGA